MDNKHSDESSYLIDSDDERYDFSLEEDDIDVEEDFSDIEELESSDNLENSEEFIEYEDKKDTKDTKVTKRKEDGSFKEDYLRYTLIQNAVNLYYQDEKYDSGFIEEIYIADNISVSSDLKIYLEQEMYSIVNIRDINLNKEICKLAKAELS